MSNVPPPLSPGDPVGADWHNRLRDSIAGRNGRPPEDAGWVVPGLDTGRVVAVLYEGGSHTGPIEDLPSKINYVIALHEHGEVWYETETERIFNRPHTRDQVPIVSAREGDAVMVLRLRQADGSFRAGTAMLTEKLAIGEPCPNTGEPAGLDAEQIRALPEHALISLLDRLNTVARQRALQPLADPTDPASPTAPTPHQDRTFPPVLGWDVSEPSARLVRDVRGVPAGRYCAAVTRSGASSAAWPAGEPGFTVGVYLSADGLSIPPTPAATVAEPGGNALDVDVAGAAFVVLQPSGVVAGLLLNVLDHVKNG